jgi:hypothetical protein
VIHHTRAGRLLYALKRCSGIWFEDQVEVMCLVLVLAVFQETLVLV